MTFTPRKKYGDFGSSKWMAYAVARTNVSMPNCFTYATARISEIVGHNQPLDTVKVNGAGDLWESHAPEFMQSSTAVPGALAIYKGGYQNYGHVAVVEVVGVNMAMSQSNYGGNLFDYVEVSKNVGSYYPGTALRLCGFLVHKELGASTGTQAGYSESQLVNESGSCTLLCDIKKRRDTPTGLEVETLKKGKKLTYTQKWVGNGHRYISWVETQANGNKYRYFVAISGSEKQGVDLWVTFNDNGVKLEDEHGWAKYKVDGVQIRKDSPTGTVVGVANANTLIEYTQKCVTSEHRYIIYKKDDHSYYVACSPSTSRSTDWCDFYSSNPDANDKGTTKDASATVDTSNVKHWGVDLSSNNGSVDLSKYDFAIIRACYGEYTDEKLSYWIKECQKLGKPYGLYCYDYALDDDQALAEANYIIKLAKQYQPTLGVWFDMEDADGYKKKHGVLTAERCLKSCQIFCEAVNEAGWYTGIYSSTWWFQNWLTNGLDSYDKWVAAWDANDGGYHSDTSMLGTIHQYSSIDNSTGKELDMDVMYVDFEHYTVKNEENSRNKSSNDKKYDTKNSTDSDSKELTSLLSMIVSLLQKFLSIFGKQ